MSIWHIKSHTTLLSADGENTNSLQFNGIWIKFMEQGRTIITETHQCRFIDTVTANGMQGKIRTGEATMSNGRVDAINGKLHVSSKPGKHESLMNLNRFRHLFPLGISNYNNLIYNIRSYNKAHFDEQKNYYQTRKDYGRKYLDNAFSLGATGPLLGGTFGAAASAIKGYSFVTVAADYANMATELSFSNLYESLVSQATKKPVIILDFDKQDDRLRDSTGQIVRAFSKNTINKRNEVIADESILQAMYNCVSGYIDGYIKRAKSLQ